MPSSERRRRLARLTGLLAAMVIASAGCGRVYPVVALPTVSLADASFFPTVEAYTSAPIVPVTGRTSRAIGSDGSALTRGNVLLSEVTSGAPCVAVSLSTPGSSGGVSVATGST